MLHTVDFGTIRENLPRAIAEEWMLISAGDPEKYNMMTASWGFVGSLWGNDAAAVLVRPQRYTMEFLSKNDYFALSFFGKSDFAKQLHAVCGSRSGRDLDKAAATGLTPVFGSETVYFEQARLVLICKKQYVGRLNPAGFCGTDMLKFYPQPDYHYTILGQIEQALISESQKEISR